MAHYRASFLVSLATVIAGVVLGACSGDSSTGETGARNDNYPGTHSGAGGSISGGGYGGGSTGTGVGSASGGSTGTAGGYSGGAYAATDAAAPPSPGSLGSGPSGIAAGEWDDNANYREFLAYLETSKYLGYTNLDVSDRQFIVVLDAAERPVANCPLTISDGVHATSLKTLSSGRTPLFPRAVGLTGSTFTVVANCAEGGAQGSLNAANEDGVLVLYTSHTRPPTTTKAIDLAFVLDTTGSMAEEIDAIKDTITAVAKKLTPQQGISVRIALVAYKDYGDEYVTKTYPFTTDVAGFRTTISEIMASGGGDTPEAVNEAMHAASLLGWRDDAFARFAFLVADAPPHIGEQYSYAAEAKTLHARGVQTFTVSASGQDDLGQAVFRQIAQYTYATNMFVLRGGAGPQSTGGGDPKTSCGTTRADFASGNLDQLIVDKVLDELALYNHDPLDIPGLHTDMKELSCADGGAPQAEADAGTDAVADSPGPSADGGAN
jgi:Mg-chelatase subunit ChlD